MAIVRNPLSSEDARGRLGRILVFIGWRGIMSVRSNVTPTNPRSAAQMAARSILTILSQAWASLTSGEVQAWRDYADAHPLSNEFGKFRATGLNWFLKLNSALLAAGESQVDTPPTTAFKGNITEYTAIKGASAGIIHCEWTLPAGAVASDKIRVDVTSMMPNEHRLPQNSDWRVYEYQDGDELESNITDLVPNAWYYTRACFVQADGRMGLWQIAQSQAKESA